MMTCTITIAHPVATMKKLFAAELEHKHARSAVAITGKGKSTTFTITAQDVTALRATLNGVTSILGVYEKTLSVTQ